MKPVLACCLVLGLPLLLMCCARAPQQPSTEPADAIEPCPSSPNCVSTQAADPEKRMTPLPYRGVRATSRALLLAIVDDMPRATVVSSGERYLHVEFRSRLFGFVDDAVFVFDDEEGVIHFRSAARSGYWDLGVNRRRMKTIAGRYRNAVLEEVAGNGF